MVLRLRVPSPQNWEHAKCLGIIATSEYDPFFEDMPEAIDYCNGDSDGSPCPIRDECLLFALTNNLKEGVWGGTSELCRRAMRRRWPLVGREPRDEWEWMTEAEAIDGLAESELIEEEDDDDD